ncbi:DUF3617 family protein [Methylophaga sp.]|uniref:DUF3617 domain-containing protein n=1 Tax=Methylophaga sp. TaxID=2024840 RepID=UPI00271DDAFC|nr:DUF3617 family protein [Methylophaga sp.]MDO8827543.1 DUF3617 family protein [Methylophaga sp.]
MLNVLRSSMLFASVVLFSTQALAETPNLQPGLWAYTSNTSIEGPMNMPPQKNSNQECLTQAKLDQGIDVLNIPKSCNVTQADIKRDRVDYAASCNMEGITTLFKGYATFHGNSLKGKMSSDMNTPLGPMTMKTDYQGERIGDCSP